MLSESFMSIMVLISVVGVLMFVVSVNRLMVGRFIVIIVI